MFICQIYVEPLQCQLTGQVTVRGVPPTSRDVTISPDGGGQCLPPVTPLLWRHRVCQRLQKVIRMGVAVFIPLFLVLPGPHVMDCWITTILFLSFIFNDAL